MTDALKSRSEWARELGTYGASFVRDAPVFGNGMLNEVWVVTGETFLVPYVIKDAERLATQAVIERCITAILSMPGTPRRVSSSSALHSRPPGKAEGERN